MKSPEENKGKSQLRKIIAALLLLMVAAPIIYLLGCKFTSDNVKLSTTIREMAASPSTPASRGTSKQNVQPTDSTSKSTQAQQQSAYQATLQTQINGSTSAGTVTVDPSTGLPIGAGAGGVGAGGGLPGQGSQPGGPAYHQQQAAYQALMEAYLRAQAQQMAQARAAGLRPGQMQAAQKAEQLARARINNMNSYNLSWSKLPPKRLQQDQFLYSLNSLRMGQRRPSSTLGRSAKSPFVPRINVAKRLVSGPQGSMPSLEEELWVIAKPSGEKAQAAEDDLGSGALMAKLPDKAEQIALPLEHTDVTATIDGYIASVEVIQKFNNPYDSKIEAVYMFPLPQNSAVNEFIMVIGDRRIRGIIRDRKEAETIYADAKRQGYTASLLTQERPNIFTQKVANIEPGKNIDIHIKYFNTLSYRDGWYEFVFPMVVGPRFNPPGSTDGIGAVARGRHGTSGQKNEVQYLKPTERSGHDIALNVNLNTGVAIEEITSTNHKITEAGDQLGLRKIAITKNDRIPNKDFVLRYRVAGKRIKSNLLTHKDKNGQYFTMMLYPPADLKSLERQPVELIFVLDCSGSMRGQPLNQAKAAVRQGLGRLNPQDTFQIIRFSNNASQLGPKPLKATGQNIQRGLNYLSQLRGSGGTRMIEGIKTALDFAHDENHLRFVCFLTDGLLSNDAQIIGEVHKRISNSRIFSFGVGSSPNRYLMNRMAKLGRGAVSYLSLKDDGAKVMDEFFDSISHPALTDIKINWGALKVKEMYPARIPDLFVGRPVILTGRFEGKMPAEIQVNGMTGGEATQVVIKATTPESGAGHEGIPSVWARMKISDLADRSTYTPNMELPDQIKEIALNHNLMSAFTAFVAVDSSQRTKGKTGTTVSQAIPVPEGVKYSTTVPSN